MSWTDVGDAAHRQKVCEDYDAGRGRKDERGRAHDQGSDPAIVVLHSEIKHAQQQSWHQACGDGWWLCVFDSTLFASAG
eukprot:2218124-Rhodomonas_salina.1